MKNKQKKNKYQKPIAISIILIIITAAFIGVRYHKNATNISNRSINKCDKIETAKNKNTNIDAIIEKMRKEKKFREALSEWVTRYYYQNAYPAMLEILRMYSDNKRDHDWFDVDYNFRKLSKTEKESLIEILDVIDEVNDYKYVHSIITDLISIYNKHRYRGR